jgi:energy-coupling factor transporter ATP-binding protein EcfA2
MGGCNSMDAAQKAALATERRRNSILNKNMLQDFEKERKVVKILLLGTGNSGKSTILKQFKLIHTESGLGDVTMHKDTISNNITRAIVLLVQGSVDLPEVTEKLGAANSSAAAELRAQYRLTVWDEITLEGGECIQVGLLCKRLWEDPVIQQTMTHESNLPTLEVPVRYFMTHIDRINDSAYIPTTDDILQARARTSGVSTSEA